MMTSRPVSRPLPPAEPAPPVRPGARDRLERQLRAAESGLTIVEAPAGWGNTSMPSACAANPGKQVRVAWVSWMRPTTSPPER